MVKRRRERDRPKAAHDAPYNPNKRVLLSYASDDDDVPDVKQEEVKAAVHPDISEAPTTLAETLEDGDSDAESSSGDSLHRELFEEAWDENEAAEAELEPAPKPTATSDDALWRRPVRKNDTTGQKAALGSLSYQWDYDEEDDEERGGEVDSEDEEAMAYLRAVRSERQGIPLVLKAPDTTSYDCIQEDGDDDARGYYEDGAYVARASLGPQLPETAKLEVEPQEAFTKALRQRFLKHRDQMHISPQPDALTALDENHPISFPQKSSKAYAEWKRLIRTRVPLPVQVRAMDQPEIFRLLELIQKHFLVREAEITDNVSTWLWSLLARLDDVGTMYNHHVWILRELGRKAVLVQLSFNDSAAATELERIADEESGDRGYSEDRATNAIPYEEASAEVASPEGLEAAKHEEPSDTGKAEQISHVRQNTLATLDMILVLVGEVFGQRDLLEFRQPWNILIGEPHG